MQCLAVSLPSSLPEFIMKSWTHPSVSCEHCSSMLLNNVPFRFVIELALCGTTLFYEWVWLKAPGQ